MVDAHLHEILDALHGKKLLPMEETETRLEKLFKKPAKYLLWCSVVAFVALGLLALGVWLFGLSAKYWLNSALCLFVVCTSSALLWMIADTLPGVVAMFFFKDDLHRTRKLTIVHDLRHARELHRFERPALILTDQWLSLRVERMRLHVGLIIGGSDKVAVLALMLGGWGLWANFPSEGITLKNFAYILFSGCIGGFGLGGLFANIVIKELSYQRDLLSLALSTATRND